jgi:hydrogenase nickel incorporation protein HypB
MCTTCGCSDPAHEKITDVEHGASPHVHADGTVHAHAHAHGHDDAEHGHAHSHDHAAVVVTLEEQVLAKNARYAERNRGWLEGRNVLALNLMSSPGAGKTTLLERTVRDLQGELTVGVIEGDQETAFDAERLRAAGCRALQINTGTGCHLEAQTFGDALRMLDPPAGSIVMIENVGNLVCPALFDLGERIRAVILSVTEGDDKPLKYPHMFRGCQLMLVNKVDLSPYVQFDLDRCVEHARRVNPDIEHLAVSATSGEGMQAWYRWLRQRLRSGVTAA